MEAISARPFALASVLVSLLIWALSKTLTTAFNSNLRKIPGPWLSAFTNLPLKFAVLAGNRTHYIHSLHEKHGPFVRIAPTEIAVADIEAWRQIHRIGSDFKKNPKWYQGQSPIQTDDATCGVFGLVDPKKASARRKLFQQAGTKKIVAEWEPNIIQLTRLTIHKIRSDLESTGRCDVMKWWTFMATDVSAELAFGESFGTVKNEEKNEMIQDIEKSMPIIGLRLEFRWLFDFLMWIPIKSDFNELWGRFRTYSKQAVANTRQASKGQTKTLFSKMVPEDGSQQLPDSLIEAEAANVLIAGTDTTAMTLTYVTFAVLKHEKVKQRLLEELQGAPEYPTGEQLEGMTYLNNVIHETMRRYPAIPGSLPRVVPSQGAIFGKYSVPAGTLVCTQSYTFHRDPNVFEDPLRFDPDRWLSATPAMREHFQPFGSPARMCLGQNIARLEMLHAVFRFFRDCPKVELAESTTDDSMEMVDYFTIQPKAGACIVTSG